MGTISGIQDDEDEDIEGVRMMVEDDEDAEIRACLVFDFGKIIFF